jgi:hypothetical protein
MVIDSGFKTTMTAKEKLDEFNVSLSESDIIMYDGYEVCGSDVVNFIKKNLGSYTGSETAPIYIQVVEGAVRYVYINNLYFSEIQDFSNAMYIKPVAVYTCTVIRDANEVIIGVRFVKR